VQIRLYTTKSHNDEIGAKTGHHISANSCRSVAYLGMVMYHGYAVTDHPGEVYTGNKTAVGVLEEDATSGLG